MRLEFRDIIFFIMATLFLLLLIFYPTHKTSEIHIDLTEPTPQVVTVVTTP